MDSAVSRSALAIAHSNHLQKRSLCTFGVRPIGDVGRDGSPNVFGLAQSRGSSELLDSPVVHGIEINLFSLQRHIHHL